MMSGNNKRYIVGELAEAIAYLQRTMLAVHGDDDEGTFFGSACARIRNAEERYIEHAND